MLQEDVVGFFGRDPHRLIDLERCSIAMDEVNRALTELRASRPGDGHSYGATFFRPRVFAQANDAVAEALREVVSTISPGQLMLIDAYCGGGFFAKFLLEKFERVIGIDWDRFAIEAAGGNATATEVYIAGDLEAELTRTLGQGDGHKTVVIVDPPASGLTANISRC